MSLDSPSTNDRFRPLRLTGRQFAVAATPIPREPQPSLRALTSLRFFAALHVMLYHLAPQSLLSEKGTVLGRLLQIGYVAVSFFFVLSGFILVYAYLPSYEAGKMSPRRFWTARFARIYPVYALAILIALVFWLPHARTHNPLSLMNAAARCFTLTQAWGPQAGTYVLVPAWSLSAEAFFYLCFPYVLTVFSRLGSRGAWRMAIVCVAAAWIAPAVYTIVGFGGERHAYWEDFFKFLPLFHLPAFLAGMAFGVAYMRTSLERRERTPWLALVGLGTAAIVLAGLIPYGPKYLFLHDGALILPAGLVIYGFACHPRVSLLTSPLLVLLGEASYSLYILHIDVANAIGAVTTRLLHHSAGGWAFTAIASIASVIVSVLAYKTVELPARTWIRKRAEMRAVPRVVAISHSEG